MNQSKQDFKSSLDERMKAYYAGKRVKKINWNDIRKQIGEKK